MSAGLMSADLTMPEARAERDALAGRTDVLDKAGVLRCLPDDLHATTEMVAEFYEVSADVIRQAVKRNREELDDDGYRVLGRSEVSDKLSLTPDELGMPRTAGSIGLYQRRAVLRLGMLLRDSSVARRVRDYLLNAEQVSPARELTGTELMAAGYVEAMKVLQQREVQIHQLEEKIAEDAPKVSYVELYVADTDCLKLRTVAANNNVGEEWLRDLLADKGWIYIETESRYSERKGCVEIRRRYSAYAHKRPYFKPVEVHEAARFKGEVMHTLKVTPAGAEAIARLISREAVA
jgi:phage antirepressor YoqD-like protein